MEKFHALLVLLSVTGACQAYNEQAPAQYPVPYIQEVQTSGVDGEIEQVGSGFIPQYPSPYVSNGSQSNGEIIESVDGKVFQQTAVCSSEYQGFQYSAYTLSSHSSMCECVNLAANANKEAFELTADGRCVGYQATVPVNSAHIVYTLQKKSGAQGTSNPRLGTQKNHYKCASTNAQKHLKCLLGTASNVQTKSKMITKCAAAGQVRKKSLRGTPEKLQKCPGSYATVVRPNRFRCQVNRQQICNRETLFGSKRHTKCAAKTSEDIENPDKALCAPVLELIKTSKNWHDAQAYCLDHGFEGLFSFSDVGTSLFAASLLKGAATTSEYWVGAKYEGINIDLRRPFDNKKTTRGGNQHIERLQEPGYWFWTNGRQVDLELEFDPRCPKEPQDQKQCGIFIIHHTPHFCNKRCDDRKHFVCTKEVRDC